MHLTRLRNPFSPLFIGEYSSTAWPCRSDRRAKTFSPLFIGEYSSTALCQHRLALPKFLSVPSSLGNTLQLGPKSWSLQLMVLSVPSSLGNTLQRAASLRKRLITVSFSPLFIGEYSSTLHSSITAPAHHDFQSPLHWGILFNTGGYVGAAETLALSVPSSLGNTLQQPEAPATAPKAATFSPLFIGEYSSTRRSGMFSLPPPALSVPSSLGNTLQQVLQSACERLRKSPFSPLFIGEYSSTRRRFFRRKLMSYSFQSPLHWGILFNYRRQSGQRG